MTSRAWQVVLWGWLVLMVICAIMIWVSKDNGSFVWFLAGLSAMIGVWICVATFSILRAIEKEHK